MVGQFYYLTIQKTFFHRGDFQKELNEKNEFDFSVLQRTVRKGYKNRHRGVPFNTIHISIRYRNIIEDM